MPTPREVRALVQRFSENRASYVSGPYNETQTRIEFVDPFFTALGWDVANVSDCAEAYKDVIHEDAIVIGGLTKAPDYSFRVGGARKFFVETKRPAVRIRDDAGAAFQLRRYAWSAKLPLSILTSFAELAVYDCRVKPERSDPASTARVLYLSCDEYDARWDELAGIFAKESVLKGSFDRYAESTKAKRGTAEVDDAFLAEIEGWREELARNLALRNPGLTQRELNFAVQRTIDRVIFLRICEDRGIEPYGALQGLLNGPNVYARLGELFRRADERYNSGLFHFRPEKGRPEPPDELTLGLTVDDKVLKDILRRLYYPDSPYEFSVLPADILGQVYEQFLGKVIRLTAGHRAVVEEKPEVRKAGGVYYTPTYIVDYIVAHTVGKLLEGKTAQEVGGFTTAWKRSANLRPLRVLDPACGSGSFLLGAYQYLLDWYQKKYVEDGPEKHAKGRNPRLYRGPGGEWRLTTAERKRILLTHIYGVDIDPQAVEVTKLSLLLKVLEGETHETLDSFYRLFQERALPDLGANIKCGNSLIGPDFFAGAEYSLPCLPPRRRRGRQVDEEERYRINPFDWRAEFPDVFPHAPSPLVGEGHLPAAPAAQAGGEGEPTGGFDAVIGNPPYIRIHRIGHTEADYLYRVFKTPVSKTDLSQLFLEQSLSLLSERGVAGFICTSQWMSTDYGREMRRLLSGGYLYEIVNFGSLPVFCSASTYPAIFIIRRAASRLLTVRTIRSSDHLSAAGIENAPTTGIEWGSLGESPWNLSDFDLLAVLEKNGVPWKPLAEIGHAYVGTLTGMDAAFVLSRKEVECLGMEADFLFPYAFRGEEVERYVRVIPDAVVIYPYAEGDSGEALLLAEDKLARCPNVYKFLCARKDELRRRKDSRRLYAAGSDWYRHLRPGRFSYIRPAKLVVKGIGRRLEVGVLPGNTCFNGANCPGIIVDKATGYGEDFVLGVLNSKLVSRHLRSVCPPKLSGYSRFTTSALNRLPLPALDSRRETDKARHDNMVSLVQTMLDLHKHLATARTAHEKTLLQRQITATDQQIDQLVYALYGLTADEIKIVEDRL